MTVSFVIEGGQSDYLPHDIEAQPGQLPLGINRTSDLEEHQEPDQRTGERFTAQN